MDPNAQGKNSLFFLIGSVAFVLFGMLIITIIGTGRSSDPQDIRARAAVEPSLHFTALVSNVDSTNATIIVDTLQFEDAEAGQPDLGTWTVNPPPDFAYAGVFPGARVTITVLPATFNATDKTLSATKIEVVK